MSDETKNPPENPPAEPAAPPAPPRKLSPRSERNHKEGRNYLVEDIELLTENRELAREVTVASPPSHRIEYEGQLYEQCGSNDGRRQYAPFVRR